MFTGPLREESVVVPPIVTGPAGKEEMLTVVVQLPVDVCAEVSLRVIDPLVPVITKETVEDGSVVPEITSVLDCVLVTVAPFKGDKIAVTGVIFVSFFKVTVCERKTLLAESVIVAVNERFPSAKEETLITTRHVPTGVTSTVLDVTVNPAPSTTTTKTFVPGSANPLTSTVGALGCEITYWKLVG